MEIQRTVTCLSSLQTRLRVCLCLIAIYVLISAKASPQLSVKESSGHLCPCSNATFRAPLSMDEAHLRAAQLSSYLSIDKTRTSSRLRLKTSATDPRMSSKSMGAVGVIVITVVLAFIIFLDLQLTDNGRSRVCKKCKSRKCSLLSASSTSLSTLSTSLPIRKVSDTGITIKVQPSSPSSAKGMENRTTESQECRHVSTVTESSNRNDGCTQRLDDKCSVQSRGSREGLETTGPSNQQAHCPESRNSEILQPLSCQKGSRVRESFTQLDRLSVLPIYHHLVIGIKQTDSNSGSEFRRHSFHCPPGTHSDKRSSDNACSNQHNTMSGLTAVLCTPKRSVPPEIVLRESKLRTIRVRE